MGGVEQRGRHHRPGAVVVPWARSLARLTLHDRQRCAAWRARASVWWGRNCWQAEQGLISALGFVVTEAMLYLRQGAGLEGCLQGRSLRDAQVCGGGLQGLPRKLQDGAMEPVKGAEDSRRAVAESVGEGMGRPQPQGQAELLLSGPCGNRARHVSSGLLHRSGCFSDRGVHAVSIGSRGPVRSCM
jgi:hypothetical protein